MASRTAILCLIAATLPAGCNRAEPRPPADETDAAPAAGSAVAPPIGNRLDTPIPVEADGQPLVYDTSAPVPFLGDFDGDGRPDLLMGMADRLLVYRNVGTRTSPQLAAPQWFDDAVPTARIPAG